jgi:hypothetical protein
LQLIQEQQQKQQGEAKRFEAPPWQFSSEFILEQVVTVTCQSAKTSNCGTYIVVV